MKRLDRLSLRGIECRCRIGVSGEERRERQTIEVDLELFADLDEAGRTGDLARTIDYRAVCDAVRGHLEAGTFHLVEAAARSVLERVLEMFPVRSARVRVRKFILPRVAHIEVEMERGREG
ncbi:MAG: dihydroneopterin aldolase [Acidobacteriota bacterium]